MSDWQTIDTYKPSGMKVRIKGGSPLDAPAHVVEPEEGFVAEYSSATSAFGPSPEGRKAFWLIEVIGEDESRSSYRYANPTHWAPL